MKKVLDILLVVLAVDLLWAAMEDDCKVIGFTDIIDW
jgi:hypothetical protein